MKINYLKIAEVAFIIIVLCALAYHFFGKPKAAETSANTLQMLQHPNAPITKRFTDEVGENHAQISGESNTVKKSDLSDTNLIRKTMLDTILKRVNIKNAQDVLEVTRLNVILKLENEKLKQDTSLLGRSLLSFRDKWLSLVINLKDSTFRLDENFNITTTKFNKWKFSPFPTRSPVIDFYSDDPRVHISGVQHLLVEQPDPFFGLRILARTSYDFSSRNIIPSAGVEIKLGPVDLGGRYYYSNKNQRWQPLASATLNMLSFCFF